MVLRLTVLKSSSLIIEYETRIFILLMLSTLAGYDLVQESDVQI
jgi:hypothetical protein